MSAESRLQILIPTYEAEATLNRLLEQLIGKLNVDPCRILIIDGGSTDGTLAIAENHAVPVLASTRGRGTQLRNGAEASERDWLLFLHADSRLEAEDWQATQDYCRPCNRGKAAYARLRFDAQGWKPRLWETGVALRCHLFALPYGDQGLLIHRSLYENVGGYAPLMQMEDVDIVRRLGRARLHALSATITTSVVKYQRNGWMQQSLRHANLLANYFFKKT